MTAYYNEHEPFAAAWLRNLIAEGHIAPGYVDERSIEDVLPAELTGYTQCHFFAGIGVWSHALRKAGWDDDRPIWTGSCPCQPFSAASHAHGRKGFADDRHVWPHFYRLIQECRPTEVAGEQVDNALGRSWLDLVANDLESSGYAFGAASLGASSGRLPMDGPRLYWFSTLSPLREREVGQGSCISVSGNGQEWPRSQADLQAIFDSPFKSGECHPQPIIRLNHDGLAPGVVKARTHAAGNAIVAPVAQTFIESIMEITA